VIEGMLDERGAVLSSGLPAGSVSYLDRDWLAAAGSRVPSLSFAPDGEFSWCGQQLGRVASGTDPTTVAAGALVSVAREAAATALERPRGAVEVVGTGLIAEYVRRLVANSGQRSGDGPGAVVDTTGDPEALRSALDRVSDLGTVVLAGESAGRTLDLDLYSGVHRRGFVVVGVAPPVNGVDLAVPADLDDADLAWCREQLAEVSAAAPVPCHSLWYRFVA